MDTTPFKVWVTFNLSEAAGKETYTYALTRSCSTLIFESLKIKTDQ